MLNRTSKDFYTTGNGDLYINDDTGDIQVADSQGLEVFKQAAIRRLMTTRGDFKDAPSTGASLTDFVGSRNNAETGSLIKAAIFGSLTNDNLFNSAGMEVRVFPVSETSVGIMLFGRVSSVEGDGFVVSLSYDMRDNKIIPRRL